MITIVVIGFLMNSLLRDLDHLSWGQYHANRVPSAKDRLLSFMRETIRQYDDDGTQFALQAPDRDLLRAASGCQDDKDLEEFQNYADEQGWIRGKSQLIKLSARLWVETQAREQGSGKQGFVAMWFDKSMNGAYTQGFKQGIALAGYEPYRVDEDPHHSDKIDDRIIAAIRQSRFVKNTFFSWWPTSPVGPAGIMRRKTKCASLVAVSITRLVLPKG